MSKNPSGRRSLYWNLSVVNARRVNSRGQLPYPELVASPLITQCDRGIVVGYHLLQHGRDRRRNLPYIRGSEHGLAELYRQQSYWMKRLGGVGRNFFGHRSQHLRSLSSAQSCVSHWLLSLCARGKRASYKWLFP